MDNPDNVIQHPTFHRKAISSGRSKEEAKRHKEAQDEKIAMRASQIRDYVASCTTPLSHDERLQLAVQLGQIIYENRPRKRGWLTGILVSANISAPEDHTKRLPRFAVKPGAKPPSPKKLASKPAPYLKIAEAWAAAMNVDSDRTMVDLFNGFPGFSAEDSFVPDDVLEQYMPLYRMLVAISESSSRDGDADKYFHALARWRWITAVDNTTRSVDLSTFRIEGLCIEDAGIDDETNTRVTSVPPVSLVWLPDRNTFETDPDDLYFFEQRFRLLPKICLFDGEQLLGVTLDTSVPYRHFWEGTGLMPEVTLKEVSATFTSGVWLALSPSGPRSEIRPHLARIFSQRVWGTYLINGEEFTFEQSTAPACVQLRNNIGRPTLTVGFCPMDDYHITMTVESVDDGLQAAFDNTFSGSPPRLIPKLIPITPVTVARELGYRIDLDGAEHTDISPFTVAPFRTGAAMVESGIRFESSDDLSHRSAQGNPTTKERLIESIQSLRKKMDAEIALIQQLSNKQQDEIIARHTGAPQAPG